MKAFQFSFLGTVVVATIVLTGCSAPTGSKTNDTSPPVSVSETPTNFAVMSEADKAIWNEAIHAFHEGTNIPGARYLDSRNPEVEAVQVLIRDFAKASFDVDYRRVSGREAIPFMTNMLVSILAVGEGDGDQFTKDRDFWVNNQVVQEVSSVTVDRILFSEGLTSAVVKYHVGVTLKSAVPAYLQKQTPVVYSKDRQLKAGETITRMYSASLEKEDGIWKVAGDSEE